VLRGWEDPRFAGGREQTLTRSLSSNEVAT
jgi:hypothetical protein